VVVVEIEISALARCGLERLWLPVIMRRPRCSMLRELRREAYSTFTATAPEAVFIVWVPQLEGGAFRMVRAVAAGHDWRHGNFRRRR
jgi:hypothetical protein